MKFTRLAVLAILLASAAIALFLAGDFLPSAVVSRNALRNDFVPLPLPSDMTRELFDIGITDINGDDHLDIFSSNHNTRQILWVADGRGGYRDMLSAWRLDQDPEFPGVEISDFVPPMTEPGVYIYWQGRNAQSQFPLVIRAHRLEEIGRLDGSLRSYSAIRGYDAGTFAVQPPIYETGREDRIPPTTMQFSSVRNGALQVQVASPGVPVTVRLGESVPLTNIFVGQQKIKPRTREFDLVFQDRHGMAWSDYNGDGLLDAYVSRGAIGGTLRKFPAIVQALVHDELLVSQTDGRYRNVTSTSGLEKRGCSGRKVSWVDFDRDGVLDLFVNCMERGFVEGQYSKQFYRQTPDRTFVDVAAEVALALPDHEIIDFAWIDVDNDGYPDLVTYEDKGFFLYRNVRGTRFSQEFIGRGKFVRADRTQLKGTSDEYWFVDGKLALADFDGDGNLDVFCASKQGNTLLLNNGKGGFSLVDPASRGLPGKSATANWVDFDNDGLMDLFAVPHGLYRQRSDHTFELTGLLALPSRTYMAAIVNWADLDNDGRRDAVMALLENFSFWNWWEKLYKTSADRFTWKLAAYRNVASSNHWLALRLVGNPGNRQAIGARVTAQTADGQQTQVVGLNDGAFFSQGHYRLYFGLGSHARVDMMTILWPDGQVQELRNVEADRLQVIRQPEAKQPMMIK